MLNIAPDARAWRWPLSAGCLLALGIGSSAAAPVARPPATVIKGRITALDTQAPITGALVRIDDARKARTDANGRYRIRLTGSIEDPPPVVIRAPGYWPRRTWLTPAAEAVRTRRSKALRGDWNLAPKPRDRFDVDFFNAVARPAAGTTRWEQPPVFRIIENRIECRGRLFPDADCPEWVVTQANIGPALRALLVTTVDRTAGLLGEAGASVQVQSVRFAPGSGIALDDLLAPGTFTLGEVAGLYNAWLAAADGTSAQRFVPRIATGLGYILSSPSQQLCDALRNHGAQSVLCEDHGLLESSAFDRLMGRALYGRPIGNRHPDRDPVPARWPR